ncbi:Rieske (2Fe-2S) iron-sulfur domain protein [Denitrovibrio acetiphilus DSM 12809]|uniref:Rieske (2Fe-2S) iron-sulfur domain protein n=1 Tax=Denitrovibrio acetiphilus (strain DSM 12809 / NBRC 114555 / N2460) TaxID=522772 RepID=D4H0P7_DENA2|nr:ubiquinol-cytochrome c reductase iron-sulfur subunit [Denitrovibrio acetiphilus]ADD68560.1 Rieske (2Fe-2S) iron-sulfur domain protein [Denitrovibrio acetiphilus DSM 12809]
MQIIKKFSRRSFLKTTGAFLVGLTGITLLCKYMSPPIEENSILAEANISDIPEGGALIFQDKQLALLRTKETITAISLSCTHLGCTVSLSDDKFACPCHGSIFSLTGEVLKGPAQKRLKKFAFSQENGKITVYRRETA